MGQEQKRHSPFLQQPQPPPSSPSMLSSFPTPNPGASPARVSGSSQPSPSLSFQQRRQPLIHRENGAAIRASQKPGCAELAGGTAAGCAAVCCCCPCGVLDFLVLTMVKLPAGLCRKALRRRKMKKQQRNADARISKDLGSDLAVRLGTRTDTDTIQSEKTSEEMVEMDKEMWERFGRAGFWRSVSQNDA